MLFIIKTIFEKLLIVLIIPVIILAEGLLSDAAASTSEMGVVSAAYLNIRSRPDRTSKSILTISKDSVVKVVSHTDNGWVKIDYRGMHGFIRNRKRYVSLFREKKKQKIKRIISGAPFNAKSDIEKKIEGHNKRIQQIGREIKDTKSEIHNISRKELTILNGLNEIDLSLNNSRKRLSLIKKEIELLEIEIRNNNNAIKDLKHVIKRNGKYIEKRLVSLYKLNKLGQANVLASADSIFDFLSRKMGMERILEADEKILKSHHDNLNRLSELQNRLTEQKGEKLALKNDYRNQISIIEQKKSKKNSLLSEIRSKKSLKLAAIESLKQAAKELNQTITALDQGFSGKRAYDAGAMNGFLARKGLMRVPVKGAIINHFGKSKDKKFLIETFHSGIKIKADRGDPVQAVSGGNVIFADWLKGYGNLIIIDHGEHYYSLYGHTEELFKEKGDLVQDREVIATVGDTGALNGAGLHFEIRHKGEPVAPLNWLKKDRY